MILLGIIVFAGLYHLIIRIPFDFRALCEISGCILFFPVYLIHLTLDGFSRISVSVNFDS